MQNNILTLGKFKNMHAMYIDIQSNKYMRLVHIDKYNILLWSTCRTSILIDR